MIVPVVGQNTSINSAAFSAKGFVIAASCCSVCVIDGCASGWGNDAACVGPAADTTAPSSPSAGKVNRDEWKGIGIGLEKVIPSTATCSGHKTLVAGSR